MIYILRILQVGAFMFDVNKYKSIQLNIQYTSIIKIKRQII